MRGTVDSLYHYPIKGLSPQRLDQVDLRPGVGFPDDRRFGLARPNSGFDPADPRPLPKRRFYMLMKDERLAALRTHLDVDTRRLTVHRDGALQLDCDLSTLNGAAEVTAFFAAALELPDGERPVLAHADPHRFTDASVASEQLMHAVSIINLASLDDLAERTGIPIDPLRFRANLYVRGWPPRTDHDLVGRELMIGPVRLRVIATTPRCAATQVDPASGRRDLPVLRLLTEHYDDLDMGVYAEILESGTIADGDPVVADRQGA